MNAMVFWSQSVVWLATYLLHSTLLIGTVWLMARFGRFGAHATDMLWKLAIVAPLCTASVQLASGVDPLAGRLEVGAPLAVEPPTSPPRVERVRPAIHVETPTVVLTVHDAPDLEFVPSPATTAAPLSGREPAPTSSTLWWPIAICAVWWLVAAGLLCALVARYRRLHRFLAPRRLVEDDRVIEAMVDLRRDPHVGPRAARTVVSQLDTLSSPVAIGRSEVCVPTRMLRRGTTVRWRAVLGHELAHLERGDYYWLLTLSVVEAVLFMQPLLRLARKGLVASAEFICDDVAIENAGRGAGASLAAILADLADAQRTDRIPTQPLPAMHARRGLLRSRVERLLDDERKPERRLGRTARFAMASITFAVMCLVAPAVGASPPPSAPTEAPSPPAVAPVPAEPTRDHTTVVIIDGAKDPLRRHERRRHRKKAKAKAKAKAWTFEAEDGHMVVVIPADAPPPPRPPIPPAVLELPPAPPVPPAPPIVVRPHHSPTLVLPPVPSDPTAADYENAMRAWEREVARATEAFERELERNVARDAEHRIERRRRDLELEVERAERRKEAAHRKLERLERQRERVRSEARRARGERQAAPSVAL